MAWSSSHLLLHAEHFVMCVVRLVQVKHHGQYSLGRVHALHVYSSDTSLCRAIVVLLLSPLPSLAVCVIVDAMPLSPPFEGLSQNLTFVVRYYATAWLLACLAMQDFRVGMQPLPFSNTRLFVSAVLVAIGTTGAYYLLASYIGFPLPYSMIMTSETAWVPLLVASFAIAWGRAAWTNTQNRRQIISFARMWSCQASLAAIQPLYVFAILHTPRSARLLVILAVSAMKIVQRIVFSNAVSHLHDIAPVVVTLNADVFSSLFITYAMQTTALSAIVGLMALDVLYLLLSLRDMGRQIQDINAIRLELDAESRHGLDTAASSKTWASPSTVPAGVPTRVPSMIERAEQLLAARTGLKQGPARSQSIQRVAPIESVMTAVVPFKHAEPVAATSSKNSPIGEQEPPPEGLTPLEQRYLLSVRRFLFTMEYVLVLNYVEAGIPFIYGEQGSNMSLGSRIL